MSVENAWSDYRYRGAGALSSLDIGRLFDRIWKLEAMRLTDEEFATLESNGYAPMTDVQTRLRKRGLLTVGCYYRIHTTDVGEQVLRVARKLRVRSPSEADIAKVSDDD